MRTVRRLAGPGLFVLVSLAILLALGGWQWRRMAEKSALIATIAARIHKAPAPFPGPAEWAATDWASLTYAPVELRGRFQHGKEAHVFFSLPKPVDGASGPGYLILTPLALEGGGTVLVNRGFVPAGAKAAAARLPGQIEGVQTLIGLVRAPEARNIFMGADDVVKNVFLVRDPAAIAGALSLGAVAPVTVDLRTPGAPGGLPIPGVTQIDIPNNHFQYALTWWSLALILAAIFLIWARGERRG